MNERMTKWTLFVGMTLCAGTSMGADDPSDAKDLTSVIALQGLPCGQVVSVKQQGDDDYIASCQDGHSYHVFVNQDGRVVVEMQN